MKKKSQVKSVSKSTNSIRVNEPLALYNSVKTISPQKQFTYREFKKISDATPFTQAEWSAMLHISERTLQRYAKNNSSFASLNAERARQIENVLKEAKVTFGSVEKFNQWIRQNPPVQNGNLSIDSLTSSDGIDKILAQLGRIQQGLFA